MSVTATPGCPAVPHRDACYVSTESAMPDGRRLEFFGQRRRSLREVRESSWSHGRAPLVLATLGPTTARMDGEMTDASVAFYFDPICPWTWNTSRWLVGVARARGLTIDWRPLSLTVLNAGKEIPEQYRAPMEVGHSTLRLVVALRDAGREAQIGDLYTEVGRRMFYDRAAPTMALVTGAAEAVGAGDLATAASDTGLDAAVEASTQEAVRLGGPDVGSPILVVGESGRGFHGPIVSPPPHGEDADRLWDAVSAFAQVRGAYELKHGREGGVTFGPRP